MATEKEVKPYFEGQKPGPCGCFFPDVVPLRDEGVRVYNCTTHGDVRETKASKALVGEERKITPKWRDVQRDKMSRMTKEQIEGVLKTRQFVQIKSVSIIVETTDGAFLKTYPTQPRMMTYQAKDGVVHDDCDNMIIQCDVRFQNPKQIQEPTGWIYQARPAKVDA